MINAWSLLYDEIYGDDEMSPCKTGHKPDDDIVITTVGSGNTASADSIAYSIDTTNVEIGYPLHLDINIKKVQIELKFRI